MYFSFQCFITTEAKYGVMTFTCAFRCLILWETSTQAASCRACCSTILLLISQPPGLALPPVHVIPLAHLHGHHSCKNGQNVCPLQQVRSAPTSQTLGIHPMCPPPSPPCPVARQIYMLYAAGPMPEPHPQLLNLSSFSYHHFCAIS